MDHRKSYRLMWISLVVGVLVMYLFLGTGKMLFAYLGVLIMLVGVGQTFKFCRCPYCGAMLRTRGKMPKKCEACGKDLPDGKKK